MIIKFIILILVMMIIFVIFSCLLCYSLLHVIVSIKMFNHNCLAMCFLWAWAVARELLVFSKFYQPFGKMASGHRALRTVTP